MERARNEDEKKVLGIDIHEKRINSKSSVSRLVVLETS